MADVFISYHTESARNLVRKISAALENVGISCWYAPRDVNVGTYARSIVDAINQCKVFLLILNREANRSEHVKSEVETAFRRLNHGCVILPFHTDGSEISEELLYYIGRFHRVERSVFSESEAIEFLLPEIARLLGKEIPVKKPNERRQIEWKAALLVILTLLGILLFFSALWIEYKDNFQSVHPIVIAFGECGENLTWRFDGNGTLTISGEGPMWRFMLDTQERTVWKNGLRYDDEWLVPYETEELTFFTTAPWWEYHDKIIRAQIQEGVTSIDPLTFLGCINLTDVFIPDSITDISLSQQSPFSRSNYGPINLKNVSLPAHISDETIAGAFQNPEIVTRRIISSQNP